MSFSVKILGSCSAMPAYGRHHSAQIVKYHGSSYLVDCGEGTQYQLQRYKTKINKLNKIFISHLHGDHFLGLFGVISSMSLMGRKLPLTVYGPRGIREIITLQLKYSESVINYPLEIVELAFPNSGVLLEEQNMRVSYFPLNHRVDCHGYVFEEIKRTHRLREHVAKLNFSKTQLLNIKKGADVMDALGTILYRNDELTFPLRKCRKYAYCSDTKYDESILQYVQGADFLYHESTFLEEHKDRAADTFHSTVKQAATIAKLGEVCNLLLGHFSSRYKDLRPFLDEAQPVFSNSYLAEEGLEFLIEDVI